MAADNDVKKATTVCCDGGTRMVIPTLAECKNLRPLASFPVKSPHAGEVAFVDRVLPYDVRLVT